MTPQHRRRFSLRVRLLVAVGLLFALVFVPLMLYLYAAHHELRRGVMRIHAQEIAAGRTAASDMRTLPRSHAGGELSYSLYAADGTLLWMSENLQRPRRLRRPEDEAAPVWIAWPHDRGHVVNVPAVLADGSILMVAKRDVAESALIQAFNAGMLRRALAMLLPGLLVCALLVLAILHWTLRPVRTAALAAARIGPGHPGIRIPAHRLPREIAVLADAANGALDRLEAAYERQQAFLADAAHELRTPLTVIDLRLQGLREGHAPDWPALDRDLRNMRRRIEQLLTLARHDAGAARATPSSVSVARVVREAAASVWPLFDRSGRALDLALDDAVQVIGVAAELREAVCNLLENALLHGKGAVSVSVRQTADSVELEVSDEGTPPTDAQACFARFRKGRSDGGGAGLGLPIVQRIAGNHGGGLRWRDTPHTCLCLTLPIAPRH